MKFKVGDRVVGTRDYDNLPIKGVAGTVVSVGKDFPPIGVHFDKDIGGHACSLYSKSCKTGYGYYVCEDCIEELSESYNKIVITTDGATTLARLYDGKKVVKSAEAKCSPSDAFNFNTGAQLAYNRLMYGTDYHPSEVAFKPEPVKLYCVKDYMPGVWVTKGKVYESSPCFNITFDDGYFTKIGYESFEEFRSRNKNVGACLVPLVNRPAKVGEWVYITEGRAIGVIGKVLDINPAGRPLVRHRDVWGMFADEDGMERTRFNLADYLVLDGYQPEPEKPKYYSGKVVCIEKKNGFLTAGKVYAFTDGKSVDDNGCSFPCIGKFESLDDLNDTMWSQFIPYLGEA